MQRKIKGLLTLMLLLVAVSASADEIRYVSKTTGKYSNDGKSWETAKANIQDAINDLVDNGLTGEVWVAAGTYTPTESTESSGGNTLYMSFKIPAGIHVHGGFKGTETTKDERETITSNPIGDIYKNQTVLSGDLSSAAEFTWNSTKEQWDASFYGNCYHVVFFATNGFDVNGRAKPNGGGYKSAMLEGCIIEHGNATNTDLAGRQHNAYGGGVYMVEGSYLSNCMVRQCVAYRNGGGIYMDGGGYVEHTGVTDCQAVGIGTSYGYGGGVCMDGPDTYGSSSNPMILRRSGVFGCVGRMGGGVALTVNDTIGNNKYKTACTGVVVANNTAITEGGGVYMNRGGAITQMTIVRNKCNGSGIISNGMTTGRSAGVYCRDNAILTNSVLWGGKCAANDDIQYAASRSGNSTSLNQYMMYVSLAQSDYTDWSGIVKKEINKLSSYNSKSDGTANSGEGYPLFRHPTPNAGYVSSAQALQFLHDTESTIATGVTLYDASGNQVTADDIKPGTTYYIDSNHTTAAVEGQDYTCGGAVYDFHPESQSSLNHMGIQTVDMDRYKQTPTYDADYDVTAKRFSTRPSLGAYTATEETIKPETTTDTDGNTVVNYYVDPLSDEGVEHTDIGSSWDQPIRFFADALEHINAANYPATTTVNVYVKQGTVYNTNSYVYGRIRDVSISVPSNVSIYGGYPSANTGTSLDGRNPNTYMTTITADTQDDYDLNVPHLLKFDKTENAVLDGFSIRYANARNTEMLNLTPVTTGAAMTFSGAKNVKIRNCGIAGNTASQGAAADIDGESVVNFENCIFHNNESRDVDANGTVKSVTGNIAVRSGSTATFCHCNFLRNVGNAIDAYGAVKVVNSMFYANMRVPLDDTRKNADKALVAVRLFDGGTFSGDHNLYDAASKTFIATNSLDATNEPILTYEYSDTSSTYPRFVNPTKNAGVSTSGDVTYYGRTISFQPHNNNPMVNRASTVDNTGAANSDHTTWGTDMTGVITRDYGGLPDIGAVENHIGSVTDEGEKTYADGQKAYGTVLYVRDYNTYTYNDDGTVSATTATDNSTTHADGTARDGSSWKNAINGNASYTWTTDAYGPVDPEASTIDNPTTYKLGMFVNNTPGSGVYYAKLNGTQYMNGSLTRTDGDDFILIDAGSGYYYIYNVTRSKYAVYTEVEAGTNKVTLSDTNTDNATWRLYSVNTDENYHTYCIQPSTTSNEEQSLSWNYYGGAKYGNNVGLYQGTDDNGKWQFIAKRPKTVQGLQYAADKAGQLMSAAYVDSTSTVTEKYNGGTATVTHTCHNFTPTTDNPQREVWVGAGIYTKTDGYSVVNHVKVYGGFPKTGNPGKNERHPQLTTGVSLSTDNQRLKVQDYETILQTNTSATATDYVGSVLSQPEECRVTLSSTSNTPQSRVVYDGAEWDGFTIRYGYKPGIFTSDSYRGKRAGGAGLMLYENVTVANCVIRENRMYGTGDCSGRGAGVYVDGSTITNCYIIENEGSCAKEMYGGGMYMIKGTIYNSVIAKNKITSTTGTRIGAGTFFESADFFNNTVVDNEGSGALGVWTASAADAHLTVYNSIIMCGSQYLVYTTSTPVKFKNCFIQSEDGEPNSNVTRDGTNKEYYHSKASVCNPFALDYDKAVANFDFRIKQKEVYNAVNAGTQFIDLDNDGESDITIPSSDMDYAERVQDCEIDMGAFEYNGAYSIEPDLTTVDGQAIYYVTPDGRGNASASNPTNAACASKLQKVLDAAGRYKYNNPSARVIVKVANNYDLAAEGETNFQYYACRTTDEADDNVRVWSIMVPRGVEVWGGYTDTYSSANYNGFYTKNTKTGVVTDQRSITGNPTYFDSYYYNKSEKQNAYTYHVVTFTDRVFDGDGKAYKAEDTVGGTSTWADGDSYMSMGDKTKDRAVIDGIYITGGKADVQVSGNSASAADINQYGGAAIVTDYAHVRNCVVRGNSATYGGALALTHNALVSGCLIDQNTADYGGGIYMFENGTQLSDGTVVNTQSTSDVYDEAMAHIYTSTVVNNKANNIGGGIWFGQSDEDINIRVNSSVFWQNTAASQANVSGLYNPEKTADNTMSTVEFFPFAYCAVQNLRLSGTNNISLGNYNTAGARFASETSTNQGVTLAKEDDTASGFAKYADFGHYGLTSYSSLVRNGMPATEYTALVKSKGLAENDFSNVDRLIATASNAVSRAYVEIGACAFNKEFSTRQLMLRLFVANPDEINMDAAQTMMDLANGIYDEDSDEAYYSQEGSSFAYPMQNLQDAIDYIIYQRSVNDAKTGLNTEGANNLPFEICIGKGTYYPSRNLAGVYGHSPGNTFVFPEGVSVYGGFAVGNPDNATSFFGGYSKPKENTAEYTKKLSENIERRYTDDDDALLSLGQGYYTIDQLPIDQLLPRRRKVDNNGNNIIEPWEFKNQTILSGDVENSETKGTYNVVKIVADQNVVGMLPTASESHATANETYKTPAYDDYVKENGAGSFDYEHGQDIVLDGLMITGGRAMNYIEGSTRYMGKYNYYCGGGLLVDGNAYCDDYNRYGGYYKYDSYSDYNTANGTSLTEEEFKALGTAVYKHNGVLGSVGYRDIPVSVVNCRFVGNEAGIGGALCTNGTMDIYGSAFEHNRAVSGHEKVLYSDGSTVNLGYAGIGGAVMATHQLSAYNTIFANNEAYDEALNCEPSEFENVIMHDSSTPRKLLGGVGGAVYMGPFGYFHLVNCDLVRNQANIYPAVFTINPNRDFTNGRNGGIGSTNTSHPSTVYYNQLINSIIWGNDINSGMSMKYDSNSLFKFNSRLICNYAPGEFTKYTAPDFTDGSNIPADQTALDDGSTGEKTAYGETAWFCAYEKNRGITPINDSDLRDLEYTPFSYARDMIHSGGKGLTPSVDTYQNCNIQLAENNLDLEGPNFVNPSSAPGYDGYNESADWSPARITNLTDNGSGRIAQKIELVNDTYKAAFETYGSEDNLPARSVCKNPATGYTTETASDFKTQGAYTTTRVLYGYEKLSANMPVGEMPYMMSAATGQELYRISYDPNPTHNQTYIDIGVYEYPHTALSYTTTGDEVDILWVSPIEKPDNGLPDGSDWSQPTSDLQRAIETLLASRNGHRKEIRLMNGTFTPIYSIDGKLAFCIDTESLNKSVTLPVAGYDADGSAVFKTGLGVVSLTIKGGYSRDLNNVYNPREYPAVIRQQARSNENSDRWDNLFYIADATQRYGYDPAVGYSNTNGNGNYAPNEDGIGYNKTVNTIPLHIDGVMLVNNQACKGVKGAAIHYEDLPDTVTSPTKAHVSVNVYYTDADCTEESPDNEPTQYYKRKVEKYYTDATYTVESDVETAYAKFAYVETDANKIVISKTKVMNSGSFVDGDNSTCAVYIGKNGGNALLYNDVMHSNQGNPLVSAVKTTIINNTYALNNGRVDLNGENTQVSSIDINQDSDGEGTGPMLAPRPASGRNVDEGSVIFNSVFWRNNNGSTQFILPGYVSAAKSGSIFSHNAVTGLSTASIDYTSDDITGNNYNVGLSDANTDVINGPNFTKPNPEAATSADIEARDFTLQPSLRLLNKGSNSLYRDQLDSSTETYNLYDLAWLTSTRTEAAGKNRFQFDIDLGAYEYQNKLHRIIYVNPNQSVSGQGNSWSDPVAYGYLQAAVDLAAVYHVNNTSEEAYVFVKGASSSNADGLHLGETLTMRNGVSVYGSILPTRSEDCPYTTTGEGTEQTRVYSQDDINTYIATLMAERSGLASPTGNRTTISGIKVPANVTFDNTNDDIVSLADGFDVTATSNRNPSGTVSEPVIDVQPSNADGRVAVRNLIVHDNDLSATPLTSLAMVNNALIYEALFRDNKVDQYAAHLKLGSGGYGVNLTVEGITLGANNTSVYNGTDDIAKDHVFNSLVNYSDHDITKHSLSGYNYRVADRNLNYQLTEQSQHIDQCEATNPIASVATLAGFIDYSSDRDLLGNPRLLKSVSGDDKIDRGAFETWRVEKSVVECKSDGNYYPHHGSVVYLMKGNSLVLEPYETQTVDGVTTRTAGTSLTPAYLLVQDGASLYGGGNAVNLGYVGVERTVSNKGAMVSMPYDMNYLGTETATNGVGVPSYSANGVLTLNAVSASAYAYNGVGRSAWNSTFYDTNSAYWTSLSDEATAANSGVLYQPASTGTCRFTAQGDAGDMSKYVYTESVDETAKTVTLTQYDDRTSTDGAADFTRQEDMGWNCIGLPWLVSDYSTADKETLSGDQHYNMNIPHTLWLWYDGQTYPDGTTAANGDGGFYSVSSWDTSDWHLADDAAARIWVGEGFFTQTAAVADKETLTFYRPVYDSSSSSKHTGLDLDSSSSAKQTELDLGEDSSAPRYNTRSYVVSRDIDNGLGDITIRTRGHVIYVLGLMGGETVTVYDASGRMYNMAIAQGNQYSTAVPMTGVYVVKVNDKVQKVLVRS